LENSVSFNLDDVLNKLKHYLPVQAPLKDFIHHNTLHAFQQSTFHDALNRANEIFGYKTYLQLADYRQLFERGKISSAALDHSLTLHNALHIKDKVLHNDYDENVNPRIENIRKHWKESFHIDMDAMVQPLLFRILSSYLDQGIATWISPFSNDGFLSAIRQLEKSSVSSLFRSKHARELLLDEDTSTLELLNLVVGEKKLFEHYLFDQQFAHPGWSGMVSVLSDNENALLDGKRIDFQDFIHFELLLEIDALDFYFGEIWSPISYRMKEKVSELFSPSIPNELSQVRAIWQDAYEKTYYDEVLNGLIQKAVTTSNQKPLLQSIFCIDDRECSLRRYIEQVHPAIDTFGTAGHFNVEFYFQPEHSPFYTKVCPAPITPRFLIKEIENPSIRKKEWHFNNRVQGLIPGFLVTQTLGFLSGLKLLASIFRPIQNAASVSSSRHMDVGASLTIEHKTGEISPDGLQIGFTVVEMADRLEGLLMSIGLNKNFAPLIYIVGHGSSSANNTHYAGYDCGACSGRPGSVNARVISFIGNHVEVRKELVKRGIEIPDTTQFVGVLHDTCRDEMSYFDEGIISAENTILHAKNKEYYLKALDLNALERSRRFVVIDSSKSLNKVHKKVKLRSASLFEPRPELNHATNTLCIVGRRSVTKGVFLDRRSFLNSFDYTVDPTGKYLLGILNAVAPVCGGINLEYYFSRVDNQMLGAGTKLPHNVMGLIGVANGVDGDLRTGLPNQMIEVHDPLRLMVIVEHFPDVVLKTMQINPSTYEWFYNEWVKIVVLHPTEKAAYLFVKGAFVPYDGLGQLLPKIQEDELMNLLKVEHDNLPVMELNH